LSLIRPSLDYTSKDFDALRARLFNLVDSAFPEWTEKQVANFGNLLVEMFAFTGDVLGYYQDSQAKESRWSQARLRRSMLGLVKLIGFSARGTSAATADITLQLAAPPVGSVTIEIGDTFRTLEAADAIVFQAITSAVIAAGADPPVATLTVEHSAPSNEVVQSTELADQEYMLNDSPFLDGSLAILASDGPYTLVEDLLSSTAINKHATVTVDENDRAHVRFGNGSLGSIPTGAITFVYKTGGGSRGNVEQNSIRRPGKAYVDTFGNAVNVTVSNPQKASGGLERQTVEGIRGSAPRSLRVPTRTVCREDYEINALRVSGVARALMVSNDEKPSVRENQGELYIVPSGGGAPSLSMIEAVIHMCTVTYPNSITFRLHVFGAVYLPINVSARVHLARGATPGVVGPAVRAALAKFFATLAPDGSDNPSIDFGFYLDGALAWSDIFNAVRDTPGVRKIDDGYSAFTLNGQDDDVDVLPQQFPILGTVTLVDAKTGIPLP